MKKAPKRFWVSRGIDNGGDADDDSDTVFREAKATISAHTVIKENACYDGFFKLTGIKLKPGEAVEIKVGKPFKWVRKCHACKQNR